MHKWVVGSVTQSGRLLKIYTYFSNNKRVVVVQSKDEEIVTKWTKREQAFALVMVILGCATGGIGWLLFSKNCEGKTCNYQ